MSIAIGIGSLIFCLFFCLMVYAFDWYVANKFLFVHEVTW